MDDKTVATDIAAYVNNIFSTLPEGFFVNGKIEITKNVVVDGVKKTVDDKFYATVFDDSGKAVSTVELKQNDKVTVTVPFSEDIKATVTYAVKETDKDGNVLDKDSFAYVVSGEGSVKLNESDQYKGSIEITNTKKDATVTPGGSMVVLVHLTVEVMHPAMAEVQQVVRLRLVTDESGILGSGSSGICDRDRMVE